MTDPNDDMPPEPPHTLTQLLAEYRNDPKDNAVVVLGDDDAVRVLAAFRNVEHSWRMPRRPPPEGATLIGRWRWLTDKWKIDHAGLAIAAGLSIDTVQIKVDVLVSNRLVFPDGTISAGAELALKAHTSQKLGLKPGRKPRT